MSRRASLPDSAGAARRSPRDRPPALPSGLDLAVACKLIEEHGADVKERTKDELRLALVTVMEQDRQPIRRRSSAPPSDEQLERWWGLVTDVELGSRERTAMTELGAAHLRVRPPLGTAR